MKRLTLIAIMSLFVLGGAAPADRVMELDILYTADIHGHISRDEATFLNPNFPPPLGGAASATAYINRAREEAALAGRPILLFDSGDLFQGTPVGMRTKGSAVVEWMNDVHYTAGALGNHDFDLGWDNTKRLCEMATFPLMALNLYSTETGQRLPWAGKPLILDVEGIKIAILGYCTETTANISFKKNVEGLDFKPMHEVMPSDIAEVRKEGADLVFVLTHAGLPYKPERDNEYRRMIDRAEAGGLPHWGMSAMELAYSIWGIDAIFGGHTHQGYDVPWEDPKTHTLVFEPYANGSSIGHITFKIDRETKTVIGFETHADRGALISLFEEEIWPDELMAEAISAKVEVAEQGLDEVIGRTDVLLERGSPNNALMGFVVADAYREVLNADFSFQNTGGVRANISPGPITERDLIGVSPFGNQMVLVEVKGSLIKSILEDRLEGRAGGIFISGGKVQYDLSRPDGDRIVSFTIGGAPFDPDKTYRLALTNYLAEGNSGMWRLRDQLKSEDLLYTGYTDLDLLREYIKMKKVLNPKNDGRWVKLSAS
jgi:5'-nucleotidase/UDP-sugar diphosphatase